MASTHGQEQFSYENPVKFSDLGRVFIIVAGKHASLDPEIHMIIKIVTSETSI